MITANMESINVSNFHSRTVKTDIKTISNSILSLPADTHYDFNSKTAFLLFTITKLFEKVHFLWRKQFIFAFLRGEKL